jgi:hypothetical protein
MSYDDWKTTEPDEPWARGQKCATRGCEHWVTFPDFESYCTNCLVEHERKRKEETNLANVFVERRR